MLVGTGDIRTWLGIEDGDKKPNAKLESISQAIQAFVENYTGRKLEAQLFNTDPDYCYFDGTGLRFMYLPVYPIWRVDELRIDNDRLFTDSSTLASTDGADLIIYGKEGKVAIDLSNSSHGSFTRGRRNVRVKYYAGYGAGSYPLPYDLKQVIIEMAVQTHKEGMTGLHAVVGPQETKIMNYLSGNSMWRKTLNSYKNYAVNAAYGYDNT